VPEALDKIVQRALARDLPDRYQSARELAEDLHTFAAQYRFKPEEMTEFMRNLFRVDYQKEADELAACGAATIDDEEPELSIESSSLVVSPAAMAPPMPPPLPPHTGNTGREPTLPVPQTTPPLGSSLLNQPPTPTPTSPSSTSPTGDGLWSRLRKKFTK
jgi:hypothetical protein